MCVSQTFSVVTDIIVSNIGHVQLIARSALRLQLISRSYILRPTLHVAVIVAAYRG